MALLVISLFHCSTISLRAGGAGTSAANFLKFGAGARYLAMGEAAAAVADDVNALYWNPANLAWLETSSLSLMYAAHVEAVQHQFAGFATPLEGWGTFGAGLQLLSAGSLRQTDDTGRDLGTASPRDFAGSAGWAATVWGPVSVGVGAKFVQSRVINSASTLAADAGVSLRLERFSAGLAARHLGGKLTFDRESQKLPATVQAGAAYALREGWLVAADGIFANDADAAFGAGTEYSRPLGTRSAAAVRAGYNTRLKDVPGLQGFSAGLGWRWQDLSFDYAWVPYGELGQTHRASVTARLGRAGK